MKTLTVNKPSRGKIKAAMVYYLMNNPIMKNNTIYYSTDMQTHVYEENDRQFAFTIYDDFIFEPGDLERLSNKKVLAATPSGALFFSISKNETGKWSTRDLMTVIYPSLLERINDVLRRN